MASCRQLLSSLNRARESSDPDLNCFSFLAFKEFLYLYVIALYKHTVFSEQTMSHEFFVWVNNADQFIGINL